MIASISRKRFLKLFGLSSATMMAFPFFRLSRKHSPKKPAGPIRIRPLAGRHYSPSFVRFCQRARFKSARQALAHVKDRRLAYLLTVQSD